MLTVYDHLLVVAVTVLLPVHDLLFWYPRLLRAEPHRRNRARNQAYLETIGIEWALSVLAVILWASHDRSWMDIGISPPGGLGFWTAALIAAGILGFFTWQRRSVGRNQDEEVQDAIRAQLEKLRPLLPHTPGQMAHFSLVAFTAGVCEELLFRGFLIWYLSQLVPSLAALALAALLFGMAHAYQGTRGVFQTAMVGLGLVILYLISGSLWIPMLVHTFIDLNTGLLAYRFFRRERRGPRAP